MNKILTSKLPIDEVYKFQQGGVKFDIKNVIGDNTLLTDIHVNTSRLHELNLQIYAAGCGYILVMNNKVCYATYEEILSIFKEQLDLFSKS